MDYEIRRLIRNSNLPSKSIPIVSRLFNQMDSIHAGDSCLSLSVAMCVAFAYISIDSDVKLGQIVVAGEPFYHAWLELKGKVIDIAIYGNVKYSDVYKELSNNKVLSVMPQINKSYQDVDDNIEYLPNKFDDDFELSQLSTAYKMSMLTYCDSAPNDGMWTSILRAFRSLNKDIETIINKSQHVKNAKTKEGEISPKEKKQISQEEKEYKSKRKEIQEKLIKFATRIPVFMYLTDFRENSLQDVITKLEPGLFRKVTGLTVKDFELLVSLNLFNGSKMNEAIYNFRRYEDNSLEYTGIRKHTPNEDVGLFNTSITRETYERMAKKQEESLTSPNLTSEILSPDMRNTDPILIPRSQHTSSPENTEPGSVNNNTKNDTVATHRKHFDKRSVSIGTMVEHKKFGTGKVVQLEGDKITVKFTVIGEKMFSFPKAFENGFLKVR